MRNAESYREYASDCLRRASAADTAEDKNIMLNMALAWVRLAHQTETVITPEDEKISELVT